MHEALYRCGVADRHSAWRAGNFAFDRTVTLSTSAPLNIGFPGQCHGVESGLWNNGSRDYSPSLGRYIESDPLGLKAGINTYAYVDGNPLSQTDPLGLCKTCRGKAKFSAIGPKQAIGIGALGISPPMGSVAISPATFGLPYGTITERIATQAKLRAVMGSASIHASGLNMVGGQPSQTFTIGDVGDANIRNSTTDRFDIYRFSLNDTANAFRKQSANTTISNLPDDFQCTDGFEEQ